MTPTIKSLDHRLGTLAEKREMAEAEPICIPLWMFMAALICGQCIVIVPALVLGYNYGEKDMERAAYRAGVGQYVEDREGNREFYFISNRNQYPAKPHKPNFNLFR